MKKQFKRLAIVAIGGLIIPFTACKKTESISNVQTEDAQGKIKTQAVGAWQTVFGEYFNDQTSFNNKWEKTGGRADYNSGICHYESWVPVLDTKDGRTVLVLTATKVGEYNFRSGHVKSGFNFKPGYNEEYVVESNIKLIAQDGANFKGFSQTYGAWPAFWTVQEGEGVWPKKGEIDIMEAYSKYGETHFASNLFYGTQYLTNLLGSTCERQYQPKNLSEGWHKYEQYWKNVNGVVTVTIKVDNVTQANYTNSANSNLNLNNFGPHNIILNLNVGHTPKGENPYYLFDNRRINLFSKTMMWVDNVVVKKRTL